MTEFNGREVPAQITVLCDSCGKKHEGNLAGASRWNEDMPIYEVTCPVDYLSDWYNLEAQIH